MTLLFVDSFDHYATADISKKWNIAGITAAIQSGAGRRGGGALRNTSSSPGVSKTIPAASSFVIGFAMSANAFGGPYTICALLDAGTPQCSLLINADGTLSVVRSTGTAVTNGTSVAALSTGSYSYIEWKVTIADSIGASSCVVKVNNVTVITVATGQDLKSTTNTTATQVRLSQTGNLSTTTHDFDDFYICDQSGSTNNDFLGDIRVDALFPTSDGNYSQFTPSTGTDHFALVDESAPNTTDYNSGVTANDRDSYGMGNLTALVSQTVYGVQANLAVLKDDAGTKSVASFVRSGSTNGDGASVGIGTSQAFVCQVFEQDPAAVAAWTETTVNAAELGVLVTA